MTTWRPTTREELEVIVAQHLQRCNAEENALFHRLRIPIRATPIDRGGKRECVFVVAEQGERVLFWDDVEEGFELASSDSDGVLRHTGASQFELLHVMRQLLDEETR